jgi:hypothetical protein
MSQLISLWSYRVKTQTKILHTCTIYGHHRVSKWVCPTSPLASRLLNSTKAGPSKTRKGVWWTHRNVAIRHTMRIMCLDCVCGLSWKQSNFWFLLCSCGWYLMCAETRCFGAVFGTQHLNNSYKHPSGPLLVRARNSYRNQPYPSLQPLSARGVSNVVGWATTQFNTK